MPTAEQVKLSDGLLDFVKKWKEKPGNLIMVLHRVQEEYGYIPRDVAMEVAKLLDVPLAKIYGVITFYHFFKQNKPGKHQISVCMGTACYLKGSGDLIEEISNIIDIGVGETTEDNEFSMEAVRCIGCCGLAPVITIDDEVFGKVTKDQLPEILAQFKGK
ncbi:MAG: NAD(P)H-dependent oxidoreductase subunit E [Spirochaetia bacterium]